MGLVVKRCTVNDLETSLNFQNLLEEYGEESAMLGLPHPVAKIDTYKRLELIKSLQAFGAWLDDTLIGFITVLSPVLPHYSALIAVGESFFVARDRRGTGAGTKLRKIAEDHAKEVGSPGLLLSAPFDGTLAEVLPHVGYREVSRVFFKKFENE